MKQVQIKTSKVEILVIDFEYKEGGDVAKLAREVLDSELGPKGKDNWNHLGGATEMTEEDWSGIVENPTQGLYPWYFEIGGGIAIRPMRHDTATESGISLLKANGVLLYNFYEKYYNDKFDGSLKIRKDWSQAESKLWHNAHVFLKQ